jgi:hypothetical protein
LLLQVGKGADASYMLIEQEDFVVGTWRPMVRGREEPALLIDVGDVRFVLDPNR